MTSTDSTTTVVATAFGGPEALSVVDRAIAAPGAGQVSVAVRAVGTNPIDCKLYSGAFGHDPGPLPIALGSEAAAVGSAAAAALVADRNRIATSAGFQRGFELGIKVLGGVPGGDPGTEVRAAARLELVRLAEAGKLKVLVAATYPLAEAAAAERPPASGHTPGTIVLVP